MLEQMLGSERCVVLPFETDVRPSRLLRRRRACIWTLSPVVCVVLPPMLLLVVQVCRG